MNNIDMLFEDHTSNGVTIKVLKDRNGPTISAWAKRVAQDSFNYGWTEFKKGDVYYQSRTPGEGGMKTEEDMTAHFLTYKGEVRILTDEFR